MSNEAAKAIIDLYQQNAKAWIELRRYDLFERAWLDRFIGLLSPTNREVLDLGCGSGRPIAGYLIGKNCQMTGIDAAASLIDVAAKTFPEQSWMMADMRQLPPLGQFDGIIAWHSFFHLTPDDQRPMFATFSKLARPGAPLMFTSGTTLGQAIGTFEGQPLYHGSLDTAEYRELLSSTGFEVVNYVENDPACGAANI